MIGYYSTYTQMFMNIIQFVWDSGILTDTVHPDTNLLTRASCEPVPTPCESCVVDLSRVAHSILR